MSTAPAGSGCQGIPSNPDISGPGVRIALYLQCFLSVVLVQISPKDAPGAYWSMTSTSIALIISSFVTGATGAISLLDAIVVVYLLLLPILVSASGLSEMAAPSNLKHNSLRSVHSPLLIVANWTRSALTYSFALYVWISAPTFGSGPTECNAATRFIFFGASLPALRSGRYLNLFVWGILTFLFAYRLVKGLNTIFVATAALFSSTASQVLLMPKEPAKEEVHTEFVTRTNFATGEVNTTGRRFRPRQIFHQLLQSVASQVLSWLPSSVYARLALICAIGAWAIVMTELELALNPLQQTSGTQWTFGQILPMVLTISPLFALYECMLSRRSSGPVAKPRMLRFSIKGARGLQRPFCEVDSFSQELIDELGEENILARRAPTVFAVISVDERQYTTFEKVGTCDPDWDEVFDIEAGDRSTVEVRIYDRKCIDRGWPAFMGSTTILPFSVLPFPHDAQRGESKVGRKKADVDDVPLVRNGVTQTGTTISISLSADTRFQPSLPYVPPPRSSGRRVEHVENRVALVKWGNKKYGRKKETTTRVHPL